MSNTPLPTESYQSQLDEKQTRLQMLLAPYFDHPAEIYKSPVSHYRMRAEFRVWHEGETAHYAMFTPGDNKTPYFLETFPVASARINALMPQIISAVNADSQLKQRLYHVEFLSTTTGDCLVTLVYHRKLDESWEQRAQQLAQDLSIDLVGRSRRQKITVTRDYVYEEMTVDGQKYRYQQVETGFTQPNAAVCESMLNWAVKAVQPFSQDLLELYCGNGNFTLPLSRCFRKVLATELSKISVKSALHNLAENQIENVTLVRLSSEEVTEALNKTREFRRLKNVDLDSYEFSTVFVDPPRAGLDDATRQLISGFNHILYISCNPDTLTRDLAELSETHQVVKAALFDQFPYTHHIEAGVLLQKM